MPSKNPDSVSRRTPADAHLKVAQERSVNVSELTKLVATHAHIATRSIHLLQNSCTRFEDQSNVPICKSDMLC